MYLFNGFLGLFMVPMII